MHYVEKIKYNFKNEKANKITFNMETVSLLKSNNLIDALQWVKASQMSIELVT